MQITIRRGRTRQRGAVLALVGFAMMAVVGAAVIGVDLGRLAMTANEAQVAADAGATSGGRAMIEGDDIQTAVESVAGDNAIDGTAVVPDDLAVALGTFDFQTRSFAAGGADPNAVQVVASREVDNFFAGVFGDATSTVTREAIAAVGTLGAGEAELPIALSDCHFPPDCTTADCLPEMEATPSTDDNNAWTGFFGGANNPDVGAFLDAPCGDGSAIPSVGVGDEISLNNGQVTDLLRGVECMVCELGQREFLVPVIAHCNENYTSASEPSNGSNGVVVGFATITIDSFNYSNGDTRNCEGSGGAPESINLHTVIRDEVGPPGAPCTGCGTFGVGLVG
jgi:hypothetical protein